MKAPVIRVVIIFSLLILSVYFAFYIHRFLPLKFQWIYPVSVLVMFFILFRQATKAFNVRIPDYMASGILGFGVMMVVAVSLYPISSVRRESEAKSFLQKHEDQLNELVKSSTGNSDKQMWINEPLNVRVLRYGDVYHFELYNFIGYGYRIMFTAGQPMQVPRSPGGSTTVNWYKLKENWYYYAYND